LKARDSSPMKEKRKFGGRKLDTIANSTRFQRAAYDYLYILNKILFTIEKNHI